MLTSSRPKPLRNRVDISTRNLARRWRKRLDKSTEEIEAAIAKVGTNATSVIKELETKRT
jgi:transposase-like protein